MYSPCTENVTYPPSLDGKLAFLRVQRRAVVLRLVLDLDAVPPARERKGRHHRARQRKGVRLGGGLPRAYAYI